MARRPPTDLSIVAKFYARWEPYEDQRRDIAADLKELFAEAKAEGLNPKSLRAAFAEEYRVQNQTADEAEKRAANDVDFELYLSVLARVREDDDQDEPEHDADGVIIEDDEIAGNGAGGAGDQVQVATVRASSSAQPIIETHERASTNDEPSPEAGPQAQASHSQGTGAGTLADREARFDGEAVSAVLPTPSAPRVDTDQGASDGGIVASVPVASNSQPAAPPSEIAEPGNRGAVVPSAAPVANDYTKPNPWCQDPEDCGVNASWNHMCGSCLRRRATVEAAGAVQ